MRPGKYLLAVAASVVIVGCAGSSYQQYDAKRNPVHSIALLTIPNPSQYQVVDWGGKASLFGAAGGIATQASARTMSAAFSAAVKTVRFDYSREMQATVIQRLRRAGFVVTPVPASREAPEKLLSNYDNVPTAGADALLDIDARVVGYSSYNITDPELRPHIHVDVRLVSAKSKAVLYSEQILFGYHNPYMSATQLPSSKRYYYKTFNAVMANKPQAMQGLKSGMEAIADRIVAQLKS